MSYFKRKEVATKLDVAREFFGEALYTQVYRRAAMDFILGGVTPDSIDVVDSINIRALQMFEDAKFMNGLRLENELGL